LIEINPENTDISDDMDLVIKDTSAVALPEFVSLFKKKS